MLSEVRAQVGQGFIREVVTLARELMEQPREGVHIVEDEAVGNQVIVLDELALLVAVILRDRGIPREGHPLDEVVECLALVGRHLDGPSQLRIGEVAQ